MNAKVNKVIDVVLKIVSVIQIIAQAVKAVFPVEQQVVQQQASTVGMTQEEAHMLKDFYNTGVK